MFRRQQLRLLVVTKGISAARYSKFFRLTKTSRLFVMKRSPVVFDSATDALHKKKKETPFSTFLASFIHSSFTSRTGSATFKSIEKLRKKMENACCAKIRGRGSETQPQNDKRHFGSGNIWWRAVAECRVHYDSASVTRCIRSCPFWSVERCKSCSSRC